MSAEVVAYNLLKVDATVAGIVGAKLYPDLVPEEQDPPSLAIRRMPGVKYVRTIHTNVPKASIVLVGIWCHQTTRELCEALADAVEVALFNGDFQPSEPNGRQPVSTAEEESDGLYATLIVAEYWQNWQ